MFKARSSTYKVALWLAMGPFTYFMAGAMANGQLHRELTLSEAVIWTLIFWPIECWYVQRDWHESAHQFRGVSAVADQAALDVGDGIFLTRVAGANPGYCLQKPCQRYRAGDHLFDRGRP